MISRRNIRIKVMQVLYSFDAAEQKPDRKEIQKALRTRFDQTRDLFIYLLHLVTETARYVETQAKQRASKHLPTAADLNVNTRLAGNSILWAILEDPAYQAALGLAKPELRTDAELIKKIFTELESTDEYKQYISNPQNDKKTDRQILKYILNELILPSEDVENAMAEWYNNYDDDIEMLQLLAQSYLDKPGSIHFGKLISEEKMRYAVDLAETIYTKEETTMEYIKPRLKNWDADRVARIDMLLLQMGVCELLYFETIPPKVTLNEYIDIAKEYSTQQSGHFINGLLDNIHKELIQEGKLHKTDFRKGNR
jgi:transcription antitermination protein NusB